MKRGIMIGVGFLAIGVVAAVAVGWWFVKRPLDAIAWLNRRALVKAGIERTNLDSPAGRQVVWRGGTGPTVMLIHGAGDRAETWSRVAADLVRDHALVIPELAGHGGSEPTTGPISLDQIVAGAEADLGSCGASPVTLVGNSLGAWVAMILAERHPDRVAMVVAVNGGAIRGQRAVNLLPSTRAEAAELTAQLRDPASIAVPPFMLDDIVRQARTGPLARLAETSGSMERWLLDDRLGSITTPVVLVWGESDQVMPLEYARRMMAGLPHATLVTIPKCGHVPQVECSADFIKTLRSVLEPAA